MQVDGQLSLFDGFEGVGVVGEAGLGYSENIVGLQILAAFQVLVLLVLSVLELAAPRLAVFLNRFFLREQSLPQPDLNPVFVPIRGFGVIAVLLHLAAAARLVVRLIFLRPVRGLDHQGRRVALTNAHVVLVSLN